MRCEEARKEIQDDYFAKGNGSYTPELQNHLIGCRRCRAHGVKLGRILQSVQLEAIVPPSNRVITQLAAELSLRGGPKERRWKRALPLILGLGLGTALLLFFLRGPSNSDARDGQVADGDTDSTPSPLELDGDDDANSPLGSFWPKNRQQHSDDRFAKISENLKKNLKADINPKTPNKPVPHNQKAPLSVAPGTAPTLATQTPQTSPLNGPKTQNPGTTLNKTADDHKKAAVTSPAPTQAIASAPQPVPMPVSSQSSQAADALHPDFVQKLRKLTVAKSKQTHDPELEPVIETGDPQAQERSLTAGQKQNLSDGEEPDPMHDPTPESVNDDHFVENESVMPCAAPAALERFEAEFVDAELLAALAELSPNNPEILAESGLPLALQESLLTGDTNALTREITQAGAGPTLYSAGSLHALIGGPPPVAGTPVSHPTLGGHDPRPYTLGALPPGTGHPGGTLLGQARGAGLTGLHGRLTGGTVVDGEPQSDSEKSDSLARENEQYAFDYCPAPLAAAFAEPSHPE